jgi:hypothetical protein
MSREDFMRSLSGTRTHPALKPTGAALCGLLTAGGTKTDFPRVDAYGPTAEGIDDCPGEAPTSIMAHPDLSPPPGYEVAK